MWVVAGPTATRAMADFGATVVRVEAANRIETARGIGPYHNNGQGPDHSGLFGNMNVNKLGLSLNLGTEAGRDVLLDLIKWCDVLTESFSPARHARLGHGLRLAQGNQARADHALNLPLRAGGTALTGRRIWHHGRCDWRLHRAGGQSRGLADRSVLRVHRLPLAALCPADDPRRAGPPRSNRRGDLHRPGARRSRRCTL